MRRFYYGWVVVGIAFLSMFFTGPGQTYSFAIFINSIIEEFGWSRTLISTLYSVATTISGSVMFLVGRLVDTIGPRKTNSIAIAGLGLACVISSLTLTPVVLFLGFFLGRFFGQGTLGLSSGTIAPQWFLRKRGLAIMLVGLGNTVASSAYPLINQYLVSQFGWRVAFRVLAGGCWLLALPLIILVLKDRPEDMGLHLDGDPPVDHSDSSSDSKPRESVREEVSLTQGEAIRTSTLWFLSYAVFQFAMVGTGIAFHFISIMESRGYSEVFAARIMSISPMVGITTTILVGLMLDRVRRPQIIMAIACAGQAAAMIQLAYLDGTAMAIAYAVLRGVSTATLILVSGVLRPMMFGRRHLGSISGVMSVTAVIGSAIGPLYFGAAYDSSGGYTGTLLISAIFPALAVVFSLLIRRPKQTRSMYLKTQ